MVNALGHPVMMATYLRYFQTMCDELIATLADAETDHDGDWGGAERAASVVWSWLLMGREGNASVP